MVAWVRFPGRRIVFSDLSFPLSRSPLCASRDGPQHDQLLLTVVLIWLYFFIIPVLICFEHEITYTISINIVLFVCTVSKLAI